MRPEINPSSHADGAFEADVARRLARIAERAAGFGQLWEREGACDDLLAQIAGLEAALAEVGGMILLHLPASDDAVGD